MKISIILFALLIASPLRGVDDFGIRLLGTSHVGGFFRDLAMYEQYCYVANEFGALIYDLSDPYNVVVAGWIATPGLSQCVTVVGDRLYLGDKPSMLRVYSLQNPLEPELLGAFATSRSPNDIVVEGNIAVVTGGTRAITQILDVSDPANINEYSRLEFRSERSGLEIEDTLLFIPFSGVSIYSIANPTHPDSLTFFDQDYFGSFEVDDTMMYAIFRAEGRRYDFFNVDLSDIHNPQILQGCDGSDWGYYSLLSKEGNFVYSIYDTLRIIDVSNPYSPGVVSRSNVENDVMFQDVHNSIICSGSIENGNCLEVIDATSPRNPQIASRIGFRSDMESVIISGDYAYVLDAIEEDQPDRQLLTISIADPDSPREVNRLNTRGAANWAFYQIDEWLYMFGGAGIRIFSLAEPESPEDLGFINIPEFGNEAGKAFGEDDVVYINTQRGLATVSLAERATPLLIDIEQDSVPPYNVTMGPSDIDANYVYVPCGYSVNIYNREDDGTLTLHQVLREVTGLANIIVYGDYAYGRHLMQGAVIMQFDENRSSLEFVSHLEGLERQFSPISRIGEYLFSVGDSSGLVIHYLGDPTNPTIVGHYDTPGSPEYIHMDWDRKLLAAADRYAFELYDFSEALALDEEQVYPKVFQLDLDISPNPFNSSTTIRFKLPNTGVVRLKVFDITGAEVATLLNSQQQDGLHKVVWTGIDQSQMPVGSGIYIIRMEAGQYVTTQKMALIK